MKILLATGLFPPDIGGPATYSKLLADRLPAQNIGVSVQSFGSVRLLPKGIRHLAYLWKLLWDGRDADVIFAQDTVSVGFPALLVSLILGKAFMVRVPGDYAWEQSHRSATGILGRIQRLVVRQADKVIVPSRGFAETVRTWVKDQSKVKTVYNGVDISEIEKAAAGATLAPKTILSAGRLVPGKGFAALIRFMKRLPGRRLEIAGDGPEEGNLKKIIAEEGLSDRVALLGRIDRTALLNKIARSEIFALNTHFESFSYQIIEAMAAGTPVIATKVGSLPELITDGESGILVGVDDENAFVSAVNKISSDADLRRKLVDTGKRKARSFSIETTISAVKGEIAILSDPSSQKGDKRFLLAKLIRYLFSGGVAAATDLILLYVFTDVFGIWYLLSSILAFLVAFVVSFVLQKFFTFQDHGIKGIHGQALIYLTVTGTNLFINTGLIYLLVEYTGMNYIVAQIVTSIAIAIESFLVYQAFIFKKNK